MEAKIHQENEKFYQEKEKPYQKKKEKIYQENEKIYEIKRAVITMGIVNYSEGGGCIQYLI